MNAPEQRYALWNYMLAEQCLLADSYEGTVLLTVTPGVLAAALEAAGEGTASGDEAEADFVAAVSGLYAARVLDSPLKLRALRSIDEADVPAGVGFLALSVTCLLPATCGDARLPTLRVLPGWLRGGGVHWLVGGTWSVAGRVLWSEARRP
jgi:hypothetical protein